MAPEYCRASAYCCMATGQQISRNDPNHAFWGLGMGGSSSSLWHRNAFARKGRLCLGALYETVQIDPFLINCGYDGRRDDRDVRRTTERSPGGTEGSNGALARDARAIEAGSGTNCRVGKAENASAHLHQGQ